MPPVFRNIEKTLAESGSEARRHGDHDGVPDRRAPGDSHDGDQAETFGKDFPASAAITVAGFADPAMMIEIQGIAVVE